MTTTPHPQNTVEIITIGDEILLGTIQDTNATWLSHQLGMHGFTVLYRTSVGDIQSFILHAFEVAQSRADIIVMTGGLGPTLDDKTRDCLATYFKSPLVLDSDTLQFLIAWTKRRGYDISDSQKRQAYFPKDAQKINNPLGTAPGIWIDKGAKTFIALPGVPREMKMMTTEMVIPQLQKKYPLQTILHRTLHTVGCSESVLAEKISDFEKSLPSFVKLAYLPGAGEVHLRLTSIGEDKLLLEKTLSHLSTQLLPLIEDHVYGFDGTSLEEVIGQKLVQQHKTLAVAESCTGGFLGHLITRVPGASRYFLGGVLAYDNAIKERLLEVPSHILQAYGAVSMETAKAMAIGVRKQCQSDYGLSITGILGPDGGTAEKPVGTVWIGVSDKHQTIAKHVVLGRDRQFNIPWAANLALNELRKYLKMIK